MCEMTRHFCQEIDGTIKNSFHGASSYDGFHAFKSRKYIFLLGPSHGPLPGIQTGDLKHCFSLLIDEVFAGATPMVLAKSHPYL